MTLLDTADIHGGRPGRSEEMPGEVLRGQRDEFVVATKFGMDMQGANGEDHGVRGSRRYVRRAVEASLRRLQIVRAVRSGPCCRSSRSRTGC